jgi:hypothetical protein
LYELCGLQITTTTTLITLIIIGIIGIIGIIIDAVSRLQQ